MKHTAAQHAHGREEFALWRSLLGAPVLWLVQFQTNYTLVPWTCKHGKFFLIHIVSAVFLVMAIFLGASAFRKMKSQQIASSGEMDAVGDFMLLLGVLLSALFSLLIVAQAIPTFVLSPCYE